jgi:hypothetical protein
MHVSRDGVSDLEILMEQQHHHACVGADVESLAYV